MYLSCVAVSRGVVAPEAENRARSPRISFSVASVRPGLAPRAPQALESEEEEAREWVSQRAEAVSVSGVEVSRLSDQRALDKEVYRNKLGKAK